MPTSTALPARRHGSRTPIALPSGSTRRRLFGGILVVCVIAVVLGVLVRMSDVPQSAPTLVGHVAPAVTLPMESGGWIEPSPARVGGIAGYPTLIVFMQTLCPLCLNQVRTVDAAEQQSAAPDLQIEYVDTPGERPQLPDAFLQRLGIYASVLLDHQDKAAAAYGVRYIPTTLLVDRHGIVRNVWQGSTTAGAIAHAVAQLPKR